MLRCLLKWKSAKDGRKVKAVRHADTASSGKQLFQFSTGVEWPRDAGRNVHGLDDLEFRPPMQTHGLLETLLRQIGNADVKKKKNQINRYRYQDTFKNCEMCPFFYKCFAVLHSRGGRGQQYIGSFDNRMAPHRVALSGCHYAYTYILIYDHLKIQPFFRYLGILNIPTYTWFLFKMSFKKNKKIHFYLDFLSFLHQKCMKVKCDCGSRPSRYEIKPRIPIVVWSRYMGQGSNGRVP